MLPRAKTKAVNWCVVLFVAGSLLFSSAANSWPMKKRKAAGSTALQAYLERARQAHGPAAPANGSLWSAQSRFADLAVDNKARGVHDLVIIRIVEQTTADAQGNVSSERKFDASSGISGLFGQVGPASGLQSLFTPTSSRKLEGSGKTSSTTRLETSLTGQVIETLPNGNLVVEASREMEMNNERQRVIVRGVIRPTDVAGDNSVLSTALANLEIELTGRGVVSDGTKPPMRVTRWLLRLLGF